MQARMLAYALGGGAIVVLFTAAGLFFIARDDVPRDGPLAGSRPALEEPLPGAISLAEALEACFPDRAPDAVAKIVGGVVRGAPYYACYRVSGDTDGSVDPVIVDRLGRDVSDASLIKEAGAWPSVGTVTSARGVLAFGVAAIIALVLVWVLHAPGTRDVGARRTSGWRTTALVMTWIVVGVGALVAFVFVVSILLYPDAAGLATVALVLATAVYGALVRDTLDGQPLVCWLRLEPTRGSLAVALVVSALLAPSLVVLSVVLAGLGEVPPTGTLVTGIVVVATGVAGLATLLVVRRWRVARQTGAARHLGAVWRRSLVLALLLAGWAGTTAFAVSVASAHAPSWQASSGDGEADGGRSEPAEDDRPPTAVERRAVELVAAVGGRRAERAFCTAGVCDLVFADDTCEVWVTVANDAAALPVLTCEETEAGPP